jgi:hypothetical protein
MHQSLRHALRLALLTLVLPLLACDPSWLTVKIPDFSSKKVEGIWIWRLSPQTNQYERDGLLLFESVTTLASGQILNYLSYSNAGDETLTAGIVRDPANPDVVTLTLGFQRGLPGVFKVSTFNAAGESPLSARSDSL